MSASKNTYELVMKWNEAKQSIESLKQRLNSAECDLSNATNRLGENLYPKDAIPNETFSIWVNGEKLGISGDVLIQVSMLNGNYKIDLRK
ncbi:MAG: hypothetical protein MUP27_08905 [Desulfobacterales bacterium]|nr:hypothetical protein [Desulfobacterales bacterium]